MDQSYQETIIFFLRMNLALALVKADPGDRFSFDQLQFVTLVDTDLTAFFDRILDDSGRLVAVQLMPLAADELVAEAVLPPSLRQFQDRSQINAHHLT